MHTPPRPLTVATVNNHTIGELESLWRSDYRNLATTIAAMARRRIDQAIAQTLQSPGWLHLALDAAWGVQAELTVAVERFSLAEDPRLGNTRKALEAMKALRVKLQREHHNSQTRINREKLSTLSPNPDHLAARILSRLFKERMYTLHERVAHSHSMPRDNPWRGGGKASFPERVEEAIDSGMIPMDRHGPHHRLRTMDWELFIRLVQKDVQEQNKRIPELRDIRLLHRWDMALAALLDRVATTARADAHSGLLYPIDYGDMPLKDAESLIRARRAYLAVWQRRQEYYARLPSQKRLMFRLEKSFFEQRERISLEARDLLRAEHPTVYAFLRQALDNHTKPDGDLVDLMVDNANYRGLVVKTITEDARTRFDLPA